MGYLLESIKKKAVLPSPPMKDELPISRQKETHLIGLRRRIASFSVRIQPLSFSKSSPEFPGGPLRRWWEWSWSWILSKKPAFARDLEMNEEEKAVLGCRSRGTLRHLFYKIRSEIKRLVQPAKLPTTADCRFRYDSFSYAHS